ncbi:hypothetical protein CBG59_01510 [Fusobacterium polymorphum]|uniref:Uncharacterized protein n=1 Tax=Fusobacterium nucleatum subsp. polymorphum TaxID=76857 RepID=A0A2C6C909_FUSNP|nr:hypothetical protein CBG59_01510 [Fusobacterium polymorphum]
MIKLENHNKLNYDNIFLLQYIIFIKNSFILREVKLQNIIFYQKYMKNLKFLEDKNLKKRIKLLRTNLL